MLADIADRLDKDVQVPRGSREQPAGRGDSESRKLWAGQPGPGAEGLDDLGWEPDLHQGTVRKWEKADHHLSPREPLHSWTGLLFGREKLCIKHKMGRYEPHGLFTRKLDLPELSQLSFRMKETTTVLMWLQVFMPGPRLQ